MVEYAIIAILGVLFYAWILYPLILAAISKPRVSCPVSRVSSNGVRSVTVLIAAHNEEKVIRPRIENALTALASLDVDTRLLIGSDGSSDMTVATAIEFEMLHDNIKAFEFKERRGKVAVLKDLIKEVARPLTPSLDSRDKADGELVGSGENLTKGNEGKEGDGSEAILVFTDANTEFEEGAVEKLLRHFADPDVGGVCGKLVFRDREKGLPARSPDLDALDKADGEKHERDTRHEWHAEDMTTGLPRQGHGNTGEGFYWKMETFLKERESALDSCLGANGAIYALRAEYFWKSVPDNTIVDDFVIGMKVREQGKRMVYEPEAVAYEEFPDVSHEWGRRVRIGAGDYQALALCRKCLLPKYGLFAWSFFSHKVLRWLTPHLCGVLFVLSFFSTGRQGGYFVFQGLGLLFFFAILGRIMKDSTLKIARVFRLCDHFVTMQIALFAGFIRWCKGDLVGSWQRTPRRGGEIGK